MPLGTSVLGDMAGAVDGLVPSHRWAGSHTAMSAQFASPVQHAENEAMLVDSVVVDIGSVRVGDKSYSAAGAPRVRGGDQVVLDVVVENQHVGHRFPGGTRDMHDAWVEVTVTDALGDRLTESQPAPGSDDDVFVLRSTILDSDGRPETLHQVHRFATPAFDRTVPPHEARIVRYAMRVPANPRMPFRVAVELKHRKHNLEFQRVACEESLSERGIAFQEGAAARGKTPMDACAPQPVTQIAHASIWIGKRAPEYEPRGGAARPLVERLLGHARGLVAGRSEHARRARSELKTATRLARKIGLRELEAEAEYLLGRVALMQGRTREVMTHCKRAEALVGSHPALARLRGQAYAAVWRWPEAEDAFEQVTTAAPQDGEAWRDLARAYGSQGKDADALLAATTGLRLQPNHEDLLRSRALALEALASPEAEEARRAWLARRSPDKAPALLARCEQTVARCYRDRQPIPLYPLKPVSTKGIHASVNRR